MHSILFRDRLNHQPLIQPELYEFICKLSFSFFIVENYAHVGK